MSDKRLGKGLGALIRSTEIRTNSISQGATLIPLKKIKVNPHQPRKLFDNKKLQEMALSIKEKGILTPITVKAEGEFFILVAGERRLKSAKIAGLKMIPAYQVNVKDDLELLEMALIENIQRENLNSIEEAEAYAVLRSQFNLTQTEIAKSVGKKRVTISNSLRILALPKEIRESIRAHEISAGHGRAILMEKTEQSKLKLWKKIKAENLSVRAVEKLVKQKANGSVQKKEIIRKLSPVLQALENEIIEILGTKVKLKHSKDGGTFTVHYFSNEDLERIMEILRSMD